LIGIRGLAQHLNISIGTVSRALNGKADVSPQTLQRVLKALRARDFTITTIRNHLAGEHPSSLFVHVWKQGPAVELARGLRFALDVATGRVVEGVNPNAFTADEKWFLEALRPYWQAPA